MKAPAPAERITVHALGWLVAGNGVGLLLATLLVAPRTGALLGPLTYGRWMPVHWNAQLYGWLALPLVGLLLQLYRPAEEEARTAVLLGRWAVSAWSATLLLGCLTWLAGRTTGKPFLEWSGLARWALVATLLFLAAALAVGFVRGRHGWSRPGRWGRGALLAALATIPLAMAVATSPRVYPPINPDSGGPTGASLLGSTLGIVWLFLLAPAILGLPRRFRASPWNRPIAVVVVWLAALHTAGYLLLELLQGGDRSHHDPVQILALATLLPWPALLALHLRRYRYPDGAGRWLGALGAWGGLLTASAFVTFLPGVLEQWKFTNALVAHAHLAMAGMTTSFAALVLIVLLRGGRLAGVLAAPGPFAVWHLGCLLYVVSMFLLGTLEGADPGLVIRGDPASNALYAFRWLAGAMMLGASFAWLQTVRRRLRTRVGRAASGGPGAERRGEAASGGERFAVEEAA